MAVFILILSVFTFVNYLIAGLFNGYDITKWDDYDWTAFAFCEIVIFIPLSIVISGGILSHLPVH